MPYYLFPFFLDAIIRFATMSILQWQVIEACLGVIVALACWGEGYGEFTKTTRLKHEQIELIKKISLGVLIVALLFEVPCVGMIDYLSSRLIDSSAQQASSAKKSAETADFLVKQIQATVNDIVKTLNVEVLVLRYRTGDDATAKDQLLHIYASGSEGERQEIAKAAPELVTVAKSEPVPAGICATPGSSSFQNLIASQDAETRKATIRDCAALIASGSLEEINGFVELRSTGFVQSLVPKLIVIAFDDQNDSVRDEAVRTLQQVFAKIKITAVEVTARSPDRGKFSSLWNRYGRNYDGWALISSADEYLARKPGNYDSASLYDLIEQTQGGYSSRELGPQFSSLLEKFRNAAEQRNSGPVGDFDYRHGNNCSDAENILSGLPTSPLAHLVSRDRGDDGFDSSFEALRYLASEKAACSPYLSLVPIVAKFGLSTSQLSRRYAAVLVLNRWTDSNLEDPLNVAALKAWLKTHENRYPLKYKPQPWQCPDCG